MSELGGITGEDALRNAEANLPALREAMENPNPGPGVMHDFECTHDPCRCEQITIPKLTAQILFDALVSSMDFGSGFLGTEEVEALRAMAVALGVDPGVATPDEFKQGYPHAFEPMPDAQIVNVYMPHVAVRDPFDGSWTTQRQGTLPEHTPCKVGTWGRPCGKAEDDPTHEVGA